MFNATATYPRACPDSSHFQSRLAHLAVGMTLLNASLFEQVDSTFPVCSHWAFRQLFSFIKRRWLNARDSDFKTGLNPSPERVFIPQFEVCINQRDKLTQRCGQVDVDKSYCWALYISLRCVLTPCNIWVACCSHSTCQNRFPLKWSIIFRNTRCDLLIIWGVWVNRLQKSTYIHWTYAVFPQRWVESQNVYICM